MLKQTRQIFSQQVTCGFKHVLWCWVIVNHFPLCRFPRMTKCHLNIPKNSSSKGIEISRINFKVWNPVFFRIFPSCLIFANELSHFNENQKHPNKTKRWANWNQNENSVLFGVSVFWQVVVFFVVFWVVLKSEKCLVNKLTPE